MRPADVDEIVGDASKGRQALGWKPTVSVAELVRLMVDSDLEAVDAGTVVPTPRQARISGM